MGLIREPDGVDFIISGGPLTPKAATEISEWIRKDRAGKAKAQELLRKVESRVLALPLDDRAELVCTILSSLAEDDLNDFTRDAIVSAFSRFCETPQNQQSNGSAGSSAASRTNSSKRTRSSGQRNAKGRKNSPTKT